MYIYLDESGDLGFDFTKQATSDYFTITVLVCDSKAVVDRIEKAVHRTLKNKVNQKRKRNLRQELKGTNTSLSVKQYFKSKMPETGWKLYAITVQKRRVNKNLQTAQGKKKLYNFLTKELLQHLPIKNTNYHKVNLVVDRCKDGEDRRDFNAYIKANLETAFPIETIIYISHESSQENKGLQAADLFCYGIHRKEYLEDKDWYQKFSGHIARHIKYLYKKK